MDKLFRKGQVGVVTAVLLAGIIISGVTASLMWGLPLLEKEQDVRILEDSLDQMNVLAESIEEIALSGGSTTVNFEIDKGSLIINEDENMIEYGVTTDAAYVSKDDWAPLNQREVRGLDFEGSQTVNDSESYGVSGTDKPGVILGLADYRGEEFNTRYRLAFRELNDLDTNEGFQIDLRVEGDMSVSSGSHTLYLESQGSETEGVSRRGGPLEKRIVSISVG